LQESTHLARRAARTVGEEFLQHGLFALIQRSCGIQEFRHVDEISTDGADGQAGGCEILKQFLEAELGEGRRAAKRQHDQKKRLTRNRERDNLAMGKGGLRRSDDANSATIFAEEPEEARP
jgi:hypothetical protein